MSRSKLRRAYPNLRAYLNETQTTHASFAEQLGVSRVVVTNLANRKAHPRGQLAIRIAALANIPIESLYDGVVIRRRRDVDRPM